MAGRILNPLPDRGLPWSPVVSRRCLPSLARRCLRDRSLNPLAPEIRSLTSLGLTSLLFIFIFARVMNHGWSSLVSLPGSRMCVSVCVKVSLCTCACVCRMKASSCAASMCVYSSNRSVSVAILVQDGRRGTDYHTGCCHREVECA